LFTTVLSPATETETVDESAKQAREQLIERHLPLVTFTVNRMTEFLGSGVMEREDAIGYGVKGLISAIDNFDTTRGATFSTYAVLRIRGAIIDAARAMDILPRTQRHRIREIEQTTWDLATQLGRWPTVKELALKSGLPINEVKLLQSQRGMQVQSLEQSMSSRDDDYEWQIEDPDESVDPANVADRQAVSKTLATAMHSLEKRERLILHMLYTQELTLRVIGAHLSISESRVSQIHQRTLARLRAHLQTKGAA
jgi:RNA polymerase sigma factor for flagellar operon FliA